MSVIQLSFLKRTKVSTGLCFKKKKDKPFEGLSESRDEEYPLSGISEVRSDKIIKQGHCQKKQLSSQQCHL